MMDESRSITDPFRKLVESHEEILTHLRIFESVLIDLERNGRRAISRQQENIHKTFEFFHTHVALHTRDEEDGLFPLLEPKLQRRPVIHPHFHRTPIQAIEEQHRKAEAETERLEILNSKFQSEEDDSRLTHLIVEFVKRGRVLIAFYHEHIRGENTAVFPLAERLLTEDEKRRIANIMNAHRGLIDSKFIS
jgi:hemerythrin-like domain-containing protein